MPIPVRLGAQLAAAAGFAFGALPADASSLVVVLGILWMTNLYNFMDGSDGLAGGMTVIGFTSLAAGAWMSGNAAASIECAIVAAAGAAFLLFNFPPAKLFMGDAGSVPLGFLAAALSLSGWRDGDWLSGFRCGLRALHRRRDRDLAHAQPPASDSGKPQQAYYQRLVRTAGVTGARRSRNTR